MGVVQEVTMAAKGRDAAATVAANIARAAKERNVTQDRIARELGVTQPQISRRLAGSPAFTVGEVVAVARLMDVPVSELLGGAAEQ